MRDEEQRLLGERLEEIRRVRHRDYLTISGALLLGLATRGAVFYFFNRQVVRRVEALTSNVRARAAGQSAPNPPSEHRDAIGELERALAGLLTPATTPVTCLAAGRAPKTDPSSSQPSAPGSPSE